MSSLVGNDVGERWGWVNVLKGRSRHLFGLTGKDLGKGVQEGYDDNDYVRGGRCICVGVLQGRDLTINIRWWESWGREVSFSTLLARVNGDDHTPTDITLV